MARAVITGVGGRMGATLARMIRDVEGLELVGATERPGSPLVGKPVELAKPATWSEWGVERQAVLAPRWRWRVDVDPASPRFGCLQLSQGGGAWCYIHGDYDLYDIIDPAHPSANLAAIETLRGVPHMRGPRLGEVQSYINERIRSDMIQHGGEVQYTDHTEQSIDVFGPNGEECTILNEYSVRAWYQGRFGGRRTISLKG